MLIFISGVPLIERRYGASDDYKEYQRRTSCIVPWCPKKPLKNKIEMIEEDSNSRII